MNERNAILVVVYFFPEMGLEKTEVTLGKKTLKYPMLFEPNTYLLPKCKLGGNRSYLQIEKDYSLHFQFFPSILIFHF